MDEALEWVPGKFIWFVLSLTFNITLIVQQKSNHVLILNLLWNEGGATGAVVMAGAVALGTYYVATRQKGKPPMFPLDEQAFLEIEVSVQYCVLE